MFVTEDLVHPSSIVGFSTGYQSLMDTSGSNLAADCMSVQLAPNLGGPLNLIVQNKIAVDDGVHKKPIPEYPLLISPITGWQLSHHHFTPRTLIFHPCHRFLYRIIKEAGFPAHFFI